MQRIGMVMAVVLAASGVATAQNISFPAPVTYYMPVAPAQVVATPVVATPVVSYRPMVTTVAAPTVTYRPVVAAPVEQLGRTAGDVPLVVTQTSVQGPEVGENVAVGQIEAFVDRLRGPVVHLAQSTEEHVTRLAAEQSGRLRRVERA